MNEEGSVVSRPGVLLVDDVPANLIALRAWLEDAIEGATTLRSSR